VVDAYTQRILERHGVAVGSPTSGKYDYEKTRGMIEGRLFRDASLYNEFHALIVNVGKNWCRKREPRCSQCPLRDFLPADSPLRSHAARVAIPIAPAQNRLLLAAETSP
jgi:endonuclease-3 related protein